MRTYDKQYIDEVTSRLERLAEDIKPQWGMMNKRQVLGHLNAVMRYTMGAGPELNDRGNFMSKQIFRRLILNGLLPIPKNIKVPRPKGMKGNVPVPEATLDELRQTMHEYLDSIANGTLKPLLHPFFGVLTAREWIKFHRAHFRHHLKQFGVGEGI